MPKKASEISEINPVWTSGKFTVFVLLLIAASMIPASLIDFPTGDSWTHGWTVEQWIRGDFILNDWSSAIALPQQILGWVMHLGVDALHWSRLSLLTMIATVLACAFAAKIPSMLYPQWQQLKDWAPLFMVVALSPTFTAKVASGFMTDGYYFLFLTGSLWLMLSVLNEPEKQSNAIWIKRWVGFAALATLAALQRTHGLTILFIPAVWILFAKILYPGKNGNAGFEKWRGWLPVILSIAGIIFALIVLGNHQFAPARSSEVSTEMKNYWVQRFMKLPVLGLIRIWLVFGILQHLGLALLPVSFIARNQKASSEAEVGKKPINWWYVGSGTLFLLLMLLRWKSGGSSGEVEYLFPYLGNSLTSEGFGPKADTLALTSGHELAPFIRYLLTALGTIGGILLIWLLSRTVKFKNIGWRSPATLIGLIGLAHLGLIYLNLYFFDRYLIPIIPFAFCWMAPFLKDAKPDYRLTAWILAGLFLAFSIWGTYDSLSWTKAKWDLALEAQKKGITPDQIVAGYEPDGYFNFSNENYPGLDFEQPLPQEAWWVDRLGLPITPYYVIFEEGADPSGTMWQPYVKTDIANEKMRIWAVPSNP